MTRRVLEAVVLTAVYFAAGTLGLSLAIVNDSASAVWPPAGLAVGAMLMLGVRVWPAITVGAFLVNYTTSHHINASLCIAAGNTLEAVTAFWLINRYAGGTRAFERPYSTLRFALFGGVVASLIAATVGTITLRTFGRADAIDTAAVWLTWWLGDAVGVVIVAPVIVMWARPPLKRWTFWRAAEMTAVAAAAVATAWVVFGDSSLGRRNYPVPFLTVPVLMWPALRLGSRETALAAVFMSIVAIIGTINNYGPFVRPSANESLLLLQAFIGVWTVVILAVSAKSKRGKALKPRCAS